MNPNEKLSCVILAAGLGTRMKSARAKVLHAAAGMPLVMYPISLARSLAARTVLVLGHQHEAVLAAVEERFGRGSVEVALQNEQLGTGHAVSQAASLLEGTPGRVLVLYGDVAVLTEPLLRRLVAAAEGHEVALLTARLGDPRGYGRVVRDERGRLVRIVEEKDATPAQLGIDEVNAGIYCFDGAFLWPSLHGLDRQNAQGELYLTDVAARAATRGEVATLLAPADEIFGVNDRTELARAERVIYARRAHAAMRAGVTIHAPETVAIGPDAILGGDVELGAGVELAGATWVADGARIEAGCVVRNARIGAGAHLKPYCVVTDAEIGERAQIGPFAHLRPASVIGPDAHVGNFVETKKTRLGAGAKANHLSYLGDAEIGERVNVGAGTITCNYDGTNKLRTVIEEGAFIGSDTQLVAPVTVGRGAYVGSGTTVVKDVPPGALALSRAPQVNKEGWVERKKDAKKKEGAGGGGAPR